MFLKRVSYEKVLPLYHRTSTTSCLLDQIQSSLPQFTENVMGYCKIIGFRVISFKTLLLNDLGG